MQYISETIMVELQQTTFRILVKIFSMETLFAIYANKVALDPLMSYKAMADTNTMYLYEVTDKPYSNEFNNSMQKEWYC